eukprot:scaffold324_cov239-Pinguiococcus_pyrenoidosus.AAC.3
MSTWNEAHSSAHRESEDVQTDRGTYRCKLLGVVHQLQNLADAQVVFDPGDVASEEREELVQHLHPELLGLHEGLRHVQGVLEHPRHVLGPDDGLLELVDPARLQGDANGLREGAVGVAAVEHLLHDGLHAVIPGAFALRLGSRIATLALHALRNVAVDAAIDHGRDIFAALSHVKERFRSQRQPAVTADHVRPSFAPIRKAPSRTHLSAWSYSSR